MKRILSILILTLISFSISSCSSDDDGSPASGNIVGTWKISRVGGILNGEEFWIPYESECPSQVDKVEFTANNLIKTYYYEEDCSLEYEEGTYEYSGNTLSTVIDGYAETNEVTLLTDTTLRVKSSDMEEDIITELKRI